MTVWDRSIGSKNIIPIHSGVHEYPSKPRHINFNEKKDGKLNLNIETWADVDKNTYMCWGDYWVKQKLLKAFNELGINTSIHPNDADVTVYLWGAPFPARSEWPFFYNPKTFNVVWFYSHPDRMTKEELRKYNKVFCLSEQFLDVLKKKEWHTDIQPTPLESCTDFRQPEGDKNHPCDILFVGNARGASVYGRESIRWLKPPDDTIVKIYGHKWHLDKYDYNREWYAGKYWDYNKLNELYYSAKITIVDGHEDMFRLGFVPMKLFDVLASGGFAVSQYNTGIEDIFGGSVPMFKNKDELNNMIKYYLVHEKERMLLVDLGQKIACHHTYKNRAQTILSSLKGEFTW